MEDTKKSKAEQKRLNQEAAGIPDSKPFAAPCGSTGETRILNSHINGVLVSELNLPPDIVAALDWHCTDEGVAEANARPMVRENSGITLGAGPWEKALEQRRDDVKDRDMDLWESRDPLKEVADQYAVPGMRSKFLNSKTKDSGAAGEHQIVKDAKGDPVTVKGMPLAHIPEEKANARARRYQERGNSLLKQMNDQYVREGGPTAVADQ